MTRTERMVVGGFLAVLMYRHIRAETIKRRLGDAGRRLRDRLGI